MFFLLLDKILSLTNMGFSATDCESALKYCDNKIDDAALWLTQNAVSQNNRNIELGQTFKINAVEVVIACN